MKKKLTTLTAFLLAVVLLLSACGSKTPSSESNTAAVKDSVTLSGSASISGFDPAMMASAADLSIADLIYDSFMEYRDGCAELQYHFITSIDALTDEPGCDLHFQSGRTFSNGEAVTAEDVKFSLEHMVASPYWCDNYSMVKEVSVVDETTIRVTFNQVSNSFIGQLAIVYLLDKSAMEELGESYGTSAENVVTSGRYKLEKIDPANNDVDLVRDDAYPGTAGEAKTIHYRQIADASTAMIALEKGEIDVLSVKQDNLELIKKNDKLDYLSLEAGVLSCLIFNTTQEPANNPKFRQAVAYALDYEALVAVSGAECENTVFWNSVWGDTPEGAAEYKHDPEKAIELLKEAGIETPYDLGEITMYSGGIPVLTVIKENLEQVGINFTINEVDTNTWVMSIITSDFVVGYLTSAGMGNDSFIGLNALLRSGSASNYALYSNAELDALLEKTGTAATAEEKYQYAGEVAKIAQEELPYLRLYQTMIYVAYNNSLKCPELGDYTHMCLDQWKAAE